MIPLGISFSRQPRRSLEEVGNRDYSQESSPSKEGPPEVPFSTRSSSRESCDLEQALYLHCHT